ncbi:pyridoxamine 5'-phosphate oxidase family protein [Maribacter sp. MAR_2009_72]|uniref:pyridoxamine 5'-phosphate oxidase family protein n=1 Tax=Maribacter sp. MAR_2009_72 TaxID=1250050 RepID=UPI001199C12E|nr:pyridoxamine 5'-phosphate oxidase family protein [Maribacter sp. MAR_2009_72]TVZ15053.1 pyridoxine/pyridoxamine 5'-phosphate oxidase [Maribacter sp. MAR_2009_72]
MSDIFFEEMRNEIFNGVNEHGHPFRTISLATVGHNAIPRLCTVVLREVTNDLKLTFYTDSRSQKIINLMLNDQIGLLMYHPDKLLQIKVEGQAHIVKDVERLKDTWNNIQPNSRRDYITQHSPSSKITNPSTIEYLNDGHYFIMIDVVPQKMEFLKLKRPHHIRIAFEKKQDTWSSTFLVP